MAGNFRGFQCLWMVDLYHFAGLNFIDSCTHTHYALYNQAYFVDLIFTVRQSSTKNAKIGPLENFPPYSIIDKYNHVHVDGGPDAIRMGK